jgi:hypothetical protein
LVEGEDEFLVHGAGVGAGWGVGAGPKVTPAASFISFNEPSMMAFPSAESFTTGLPAEKSMVFSF